MNHSDTITKNSWLISLTIGLGFIGLSLISQLTSGIEWASLDIAQTREGQIWRLITGHLTHLDWEHYFLNMAAITLSLVVFHNDIKPSHWIGSFLFISIFSSLCMVFGFSEYDRYVGFSDVIHGWILLGAASIAHKEPKLTAAIFVLFWLKIIEENMDFHFFTSFAVTGNVAYESHIYGAIGGVLFSLIFVKAFRGRVMQLFGKKYEGGMSSD